MKSNTPSPPENSSIIPNTHTHAHTHAHTHMHTHTHMHAQTKMLEDLLTFFMYTHPVLTLQDISITSKSHLKPYLINNKNPVGHRTQIKGYDKLDLGQQL